LRRQRLRRHGAADDVRARLPGTDRPDVAGTPNRELAAGGAPLGTVQRLSLAHARVSVGTGDASLGRLGRTERATSIGLVIGAVASVQLGAAVATTLFDELGPSGTVLLRTGFAAVILVAIWRPTVRARPSDALRDAVLLGLALAGM